jgi:hypothetical protein
MNHPLAIDPSEITHALIVQGAAVTVIAHWNGFRGEAHRDCRARHADYVSLQLEAQENLHHVVSDALTTGGHHAR